MRTVRRILSPTATAWLYWQGVGMIVVLFGLGKAVSHALGGLDHLLFGLADVAALAAIVAVVGAVTWQRCLHLQRMYAASLARRREIDVLAAENEAVIRVARAVAREFAQPLSGALGYSELLMMRAESLANGERHEVEGVREGVLQLERMLQALNQTAQSNGVCVSGQSLADQVESCVAAPRPRLHVRAAVAAVQRDEPTTPGPCCT